MSEDLIKRCLSLSIDEKRQLIARIKNSLDGVDSWRADRLLEIYGEVTGLKPNLYCRDRDHVWAKAMVAYQLLQEGIPWSRLPCPFANRIIHPSSTTGKRCKMPWMCHQPTGTSLTYGTNFKNRFNHEIHRGTNQDPLSMGGQFPDCSQCTMGKESRIRRTQGDLGDLHHHHRRQAEIQ